MTAVHLLDTRGSVRRVVCGRLAAGLRTSIFRASVTCKSCLARRVYVSSPRVR